MLRKITILILTLIVILFFSPTIHAQENMPPANVVVSGAVTGMVTPESEFIGTVYYHEVSEVACEVSGKVETMNFEEGQRVKEGVDLVKLNSDLLMSDLNKAELDFKRAENLYKEDLISEQSFDESRFEVDRLRIELHKKTIKSPFDGVVIKKHVERGEWLSPGSVVATVADDNMIDIITEVPGDIVRFIDQNMGVKLKAGGKEFKGKVSAIIQRGDISTRTFPVKVRAENSMSLIEGMEAMVMLPVGEKQQAVTVPRDAVLSMFGMTVIFVVTDSKASMLPVKVAGYDGLKAGVLAEGLREGMKVVVKGNERLRDGQEVNIQQ